MRVLRGHDGGTISRLVEAFSCDHVECLKNRVSGTDAPVWMFTGLTMSSARHNSARSGPGRAYMKCSRLL